MNLKSTFLMAGVALSLSAMTPQTFAESYFNMNFENLYSETEKEVSLTSESLKEYINSNTADTDGFIKSISYIQSVFAREKGLGSVPTFSSDTGAVFIYPDNEEDPESIGGMTLEIDPKYWQPVNKVNFVTYKCPDNWGKGSLPTAIEVSINDEKYIRYSTPEPTGQPKIKELISVPTSDKIIKKISVRVPNVLKEDSPTSSIEYYIAFSRIILVYEPQEATEVSEWSFSSPMYNAYVNDNSPLDLPVLRAVPAEAAELAVYSSSDPEVAEVNDGKIIINSEGTCIISASLMPNSLFTSSLGDASYELSVKNNTSTIVFSPTINYNNNSEKLDIQGRKVSGNLKSGIYIIRKNDKYHKIILK